VACIRTCWHYISTRKADWWIAAFTAGLALATAALAFATFALVGSTNQLAFVEKEHGEEEWRRVVHATIGQLANATNASPARRLCARYVIAADDANGIRAEDAGKAARSRTTATNDADADSPAVLNSPVTKSLLEAVVGNVPLSDDYNITLSNTKFAPLARSCLSSLFRDGDTGNLATKEKGVVVAHLHRELVGYQNAVEAAANLFKNVELPPSAQKSLADNLVGAFDNDTRLFLEATIVYMFFTDRETSGTVDPDLKNLRKFAVDEFTLCDEHLVFEDKPVGQCFQKEYKATPFLARPSVAK